MKQRRFGFTLIELLIVIALLGALAIGLLAALDPFEQLKKGTDTGIRNTTAEIQGASIRFFAVKNQMPWCNAADGTQCTDPSENTLTELNGGDPNTSPYAAIDQMITAGELKTDFETLAGGQLDLIYVTGTADPPTVGACYKPTSKSFQSDGNTKFNRDGTEVTDGSCKSQGGGIDCWYCVK